MSKPMDNETRLEWLTVWLQESIKARGTPTDMEMVLAWFAADMLQIIKKHEMEIKDGS